MSTSFNTFVSPTLQGMDDLLCLLERQMEDVLLANGSENSEAAKAAIYHLKSGGRRIRARLALHASLSLGLSSPDALALAAVVEFLHNASLVHDDLQDDELLRHGVSTVGAVFGTNVAICTGDLLLSGAYAALANFSQANLLAPLIAMVHTATAAAIRGQCAGFPQLKVAPRNMDEYRRVATAKSGALFSLPLQLALVGAGKKQWLAQARFAAEEFAVGYQIMDDLQDVYDDGPMGMNAVTVLKDCGYGDNAPVYAREMGLHHLQNAVGLAENLPDGVGDLLRDLAISLCQGRLTY